MEIVAISAGCIFFLLNFPSETEIYPLIIVKSAYFCSEQNRIRYVQNTYMRRNPHQSSGFGSNPCRLGSAHQEPWRNDFYRSTDRYGLTQLVFDEKTDQTVAETANHLGREYVVQAAGVVRERSSKNKNMPTGEVELYVTSLNILNSSETPPFTIEDESDGGDEIRMKYRYLDLRRTPVRDTLILRSKMAFATRTYLDGLDFIETETPVLIKSTPEGARDFVVPSRMNPGEFYALPQSPQSLKQLLMVAGFDRYYQIVKCCLLY